MWVQLDITGDFRHGFVSMIKPLYFLLLKFFDFSMAASNFVVCDHLIYYQNLSCAAVWYAFIVHKICAHDNEHAKEVS